MQLGSPLLPAWVKAPRAQVYRRPFPSILFAIGVFALLAYCTLLWRESHQVGGLVLGDPVEAVNNATGPCSFCAKDTPKAGGPLKWDTSRPVEKDPTEDAKNGTLGFGRVYYISMPGRTDRQDSMELLASTTDVTLTRLDGVNASTMPPQAIPRNGGNLRPGQVACYRAHANAWQAVLRSGHETALILEDDVDWDMNIHHITPLLAKAMRSRTWAIAEDPSPFAEGTLSPKAAAELRKNNVGGSPYGIDWDVMYVGTCWDIRNDSDTRVTAYLDPFGPKKSQMANSYFNELKSYGYKPTEKIHDIKRLLTPSNYPVCTNGYAVTKRGAQKLLWRGTYEGLDGNPIDLAMIEWVKRGWVRGVTVLPPIITYWDGGDGGSDVRDGEQSEGVWAGNSTNLQRSGREEIRKVWGHYEEEQARKKEEEEKEREEEEKKKEEEERKKEEEERKKSAEEKEREEEEERRKEEEKKDREEQAKKAEEERKKKEKEETKS